MGFKYSNPGYIRKLSKPQKYKALRTSAGFYYFLIYHDGLEALMCKIKDAIERGWTLREFIKYNEYTKELEKKIATQLELHANKPLKNHLR